jgi:antirestriction protein ArdC
MQNPVAHETNTATDSQGSRTVYDVITERVIALIESTNALPWEIPWRVSSVGGPVNFLTKKPYRGINLILLSFLSLNCPYWASFRQIQSLGGRVKKGAKGMPIVYWHRPEGKGSKTEEREEEGRQSYSFVRYSTVFNLLDTEGIDFEIEAVPQLSNDQRNARCEEIIAGFVKPPAISFGGASAFYSPLKDLVAVPAIEAFKSPELFYSTLFHELAHSTGHSSRLGRDMSPLGNGAAPHRYAEEEIVAEMAASFLCAEAGIERECMEDSTNYLSSWIKTMRADKKLIIRAASKAQKAADYILGKGG